MASYRATLKPEGIPIDEAQDIKTFTFDTETASPENVHEAAAEHIINEGVIDAWAFRKYWEVAAVTFSDPDVDELRNNLINMTESDAADYQNRRSVSTSVFKMQFLADDGSGWTTGRLVLTDETLRGYQRWRQDIDDKDAVTAQEAPFIHEMMLYTALEVSGSYAQKVPENPSAHDDLIRTAIRFDNLLMNLLKDLTP